MALKQSIKPPPMSPLIKQLRFVQVILIYSDDDDGGGGGDDGKSKKYKKNHNKHIN